MFFKGKVEAEIREIPSLLDSIKFSSDADFDTYMLSMLYHHDSSFKCQLKGIVPGIVELLF